eukprot:193689_1
MQPHNNKRNWYDSLSREQLVNVLNHFGSNSNNCASQTTTQNISGSSQTFSVNCQKRKYCLDMPLKDKELYNMAYKKYIKQLHGDRMHFVTTLNEQQQLFQKYNIHEPNSSANVKFIDKFVCINCPQNIKNPNSPHVIIKLFSMFNIMKHMKNIHFDIHDSFQAFWRTDQKQITQSKQIPNFHVQPSLKKMKLNTNINCSSNINDSKQILIHNKPVVYHQPQNTLFHTMPTLESIVENQTNITDVHSVTQSPPKCTQIDSPNIKNDISPVAINLCADETDAIDAQSMPPTATSTSLPVSTHKSEPIELSSDESDCDDDVIFIRQNNSNRNSNNSNKRVFVKYPKTHKTTFITDEYIPAKDTNSTMNIHANNSQNVLDSTTIHSVSTA